jgi:hypothetical protein
MDSIDEKLATLIEQALDECLSIEALAIKQGPEWLVDSAAESVKAIKGYLKSAKAGKLPRPSQGAGLGFSRGLGEWAEDYEELMGLAYKIDEFYSNDCNSKRIIT